MTVYGMAGLPVLGRTWAGGNAAAGAPVGRRSTRKKRKGAVPALVWTCFAFTGTAITLPASVVVAASPTRVVSVPSATYTKLGPTTLSAVALPGGRVNSCTRS